MKSWYRYALAFCAGVLLAVPAVAFAQTDTGRRVVNLIVSEDGSEVRVKNTIQTTGRISFTHDGVDYIVKAPLTIDVNAVIPLTDSASRVVSATRIGAFAVELLSYAETDKFEHGYRTVESETEEDKIVVIGIRLTNVGDESAKLAEWFSGDGVDAFDDLGRRFERSGLFGCDELNPGSAVDCFVVFKVEQSVSLIGLEFRVGQKRVIPIPESFEKES